MTWPLGSSRSSAIGCRDERPAGADEVLPMSDLLVVAEARRGELRDVSLELIAAALELKPQAGGRVLVAVLDGDPQRFAPALSVEGVDEILLVTTPREHFEPHLWQRALEGLIEAEHPG